MTRLPLSALELASVVDRGPLGPQIRLKQISPGRWRGLCPFHHDTTTPNFDVYETRPGEKGRFYCHNCQQKGDAIEWRMRMENKSFREVGGDFFDSKSLEQRQQVGRKARQLRSLERRFYDRYPDAGPEWQWFLQGYVPNTLEQSK